MLLFTSIPPRFSRKDSRTGEEIGHAYLAACVESWRRNGFQPISINRPDEAESIRQMGIIEVHAADMSEAHEPTRFGPPLAAIFDSFPEDAPAAIINADVYLMNANLADVIRSLPRKSLIAGRRADVDFLGAETGETFLLGYDFFATHRSEIGPIVNHAGIRRFQLGAPWWDYVFPVACLSAVKPYRLREPLLIHQKHEDRWNPGIWEGLAIESCKALAEIDPSGFRPLLYGFDGTPAPGSQIALACHARLFSDTFEELPVPISPCRFFNTLPVLQEPPASVKILDSALRPPKKGLVRRLVHGLRDILRVWRRHLGLIA